MPSIYHIALALPAIFLSVSATPAPYSLKLSSRQPSAPTPRDVPYQCYTGQNFPFLWLTWDELREKNEPAIREANGPEVTESILSAIQAVSQEIAHGSPGFILAIVMQDSGGALAHVGDDGKTNGLMQVNIASDGSVQCDQPTCTLDQIKDMLRLGLLGHTGPGASKSPGFEYYQSLNSTPTPAALRAYNSGTVADKDNYQKVTSCKSNSYVSDIGNRLIGLSPDKFPSQDERNKMCGFDPDPQSQC